MREVRGLVLAEARRRPKQRVGGDRLTPSPHRGASENSTETRLVPRSHLAIDPLLGKKLQTQCPGGLLPSAVNDMRPSPRLDVTR
jgi:hypothetical protein